MEGLLRRHRILAWLLAGLIFAMTVGFFALMGFDAPMLSRIAVGRSISFANIVAVGMILMFLLTIVIFGRSAARIDEALLRRRLDR
jgi:uncharacterized membrane protein (DUF485 family)